MLLWISLLLSFLAWPSDASKERCLKTSHAAAPRFPVARSLDTLQAQFNQLYESDSRLHGRVYWEEKDNSYLATYSNKTVKIPLPFIEAVTTHLKIALERGYANFLFYSDMGHGHLIYSTERWGNLAKEENKLQVLENLLNANSEKVLYHTAELFQLKAGENFDGALSEDSWLQWRYYSRNFTGDLAVKENVAVYFAKNQKFNTVREIEGHREWSTFYFSANKNGCFPVHLKNKTIYFDLSFTL
jgi:hypothetical protein